jgi:RNA polymerase sigma-70 factor (ECF subfamily)
MTFAYNESCQSDHSQAEYFMSNSDELSTRLEHIETRWSIVQQAHKSSQTIASQARNDLVTRYTPAITKYVHAVVKDNHESEELAQEFVLRILNGDFAGADPHRGRFRDLLKTAVRNMIRNHWQKQNRRRVVDIDGIDELSDGDADSADLWNDSWRKTVLNLTWDELEKYQNSKSDNVFFDLMKLRAAHPDADSKQLAELLTRQTGRNYNAAACRQQLRRARVKFAELLIGEIADGLDDPAPDRVQVELAELGFLDIIRNLVPNNDAL